MVGCDVCDGTNNHYGHGGQNFLYNGMTRLQLQAKNITIEPWNPPAGAMYVLALPSNKGHSCPMRVGTIVALHIDRTSSPHSSPTVLPHSLTNNLLLALLALLASRARLLAGKSIPPR